jgi:NAD(P)-dependent dehydrogenase (short-subunit alcohol dehydrogenase family)
MGKCHTKDARDMTKPVVLVTGAAGKLGSALCCSLLPDNEVVAAYHERVPEIPSQLAWPATTGPQEHAGTAWCVKADLNDSKHVMRLVEVCLAKHGRIDIVVNLAADTKYHGPLTDLCYDRETAGNQLAINSIAPFALVSTIFHETWKHERDSNSLYNRNVINLSSFSGMYVQQVRGQALYGASKAALNLLTLHLAVELAPYAVRVNSLCPSRFPDNIATNRVVAAIKKIAIGTQTGEIIELTSRS